MASDQQVAILRQGVAVWNEWRNANAGMELDLSWADLADFDLSHAKLNWTNLSHANLQGAILEDADMVRANLTAADVRGARCIRADFRGAFFTSPNADMALITAANFSSADLSEAILTKVDLTGVKFVNARLRGVNLSGSILEQADLTCADISASNLSGVLFIGTRLQHAILTDSIVYGASVWNAYLEGAEQANLRISRWDEPALVVDNLEVAQFLYLMVHNEKLRHVIDTITSKVVLILGRFSEERKPVLDALRQELRLHNYVPVLFDFNPPQNRNLTETITTLSLMARFIVADITDPSSVPHELGSLAPHLTSVVVQPILQEGRSEYAMVNDLKERPWFLDTYRYQDAVTLLANLDECVIKPAEQKARELIMSRIERRG